MIDMKVLVSTNILPVDIRDIPSIMKGNKGDKGDKGADGRDGSYVQKAYKTYAGMVADKDNIPTNTNVVVNNDPDINKNAYYTYDGTEFTKSDFDPQGILTSVDVRLNQAVESASEYFQSQVADTIATSIDNSTVAYNQAIEVTKGEWADTISTTSDIIKANNDKYLATIPGTVNDAINNTAVAGGILADTFVTMTENEAGSTPTNLRNVYSKLELNFNSVAEMLKGNVGLGKKASSGYTTWKRTKVSSPTVISDFIPLDGIWVTDFGADNTGTVDSTAKIQLALDTAGHRTEVKWAAGNYLTSQTLNCKSGKFTGVTRFNSVAVTITSSAVPALHFLHINSLEIDGFNISSTANLAPTDVVLLLEGCTYYKLKNTRVSNTHNNSVTRTGTAIKIVNSDTRFSGYGYVEGTSTPYFDTGIDSDNTLVSFKDITCSLNRIGLHLKGETAYLDSCDIAGNTEWGILSELTLSLTAINTYNEEAFLDKLVKAKIKPAYGMEFLGGKKFLRNTGKGFTLADIGQSLAHDVGIPIKNNGAANTINLLPNPLGGGDFSDFGYSASFGVDYDYNDKPNGAIASLVIDSSVVSPIKDCNIDPVKIPANTGISQSLWVKRISGTGYLSIRLQDASNDIRISVIDVDESMSPLGEWVKVTYTPRSDVTSDEVTLANVRYLLYDGVFKVAKHVASVGGYIFDSSHTPLTKELGGTITSSKLALPNLPVAKTGTSVGDLWIDGNTVRVNNAVITSGATGARPTGVSVGFVYFDTTLGKPVYFKAAGVWVDATGATV